MTDEAQKKFELAREIGPLARHQLRAEVLLRGYEAELTDAEREELIRIASAPLSDDWEYLSQFDRLLKDE